MSQVNRGATRTRIGSIVFLALVTFLTAACAYAAPSGHSVESVNFLHEAQLLDPRSASTDPFELNARITVHRDDHSVEDGTYKLLWFSQTQWREEISSVGFHQVRVGGKGGVWQTREPSYPTFRIWQLIQAVNFYSRLTLWPEETASKLKSTKRNGVEVRCMKTAWKGLSPMRELCFSENSPELVREEYLPSSRSYEFSDYSSVGSSRMPKSIKVFDGKNLVVELSVEMLERVSETSAVPQKPADAKWLNWCPNPNPAESIPPFPTRPHESSVVVYGSIEPDGRWHDLKILESGGSARDAAALKRMTEERFRPASCSGVPVTIETIARQ